VVAMNRRFAKVAKHREHVSCSLTSSSTFYQSSLLPIARRLNN